MLTSTQSTELSVNTAKPQSKAVRTAGKPEHVLDERREHVPRLHVNERAEEVESVSRSQRDDDVTECRIGRDETVTSRSASHR